MAEVSFDKDLRWLLVGMLFALVIAETAMQASRLVAVVRAYKPLNRDQFGEICSVVAHLLLVTAVVTTSWVGWSQSIAAEIHEQHHLRIVFSAPYLLLLIDIGLLICYFIMLKSVAIPDPKEEWTKITPSAREDSFWLMLIFLGYLLWTVVNYWFLHGASEFWKHAPPTAACFVITIGVWTVARNLKTAKTVIIADAFMLLLVFLYRYIKELPFS